MELEEDRKQSENSNRASHLFPWQYKKGFSGNPSGRPAGKSLKQYTIEKLNAMTDEEREEFLEGIDKKVIWEMAEGRAKQESEIAIKELPIIQIAREIIEKYDINPSTEHNS